MSNNQVNITGEGLLSGNLSGAVMNRIRLVRSQACVTSFIHGIYNFTREFREEARIKGLSAYDYAESLGNLDQYLGELRDYQTVGAAFMYTSPRSMLGDAAGIGKTPQICGMINAMRKFYNPAVGHTVYGNRLRILVAAENSAVGQIAAEIAKFTGLRVTVLKSKKPQMKRQTKNFYLTHEIEGTEPDKKTTDFDVLVITHSTLRSDTFYTWFSRVMHAFGTFILDESYVVKNPKTTTSKYVEVLCAKFDRVHFLNATVFETRLLDVVNQFNLLFPGFLPPKSIIERDYCQYRWATFPIRGGGGQMGNKRELVCYRNQEPFKKSLFFAYMTRKKKDVNASDTERFYQAYLVEQTKAQKAAIRQGYRYFEVLNCPSLCMDLELPNEPANVPKLKRLIDLVSEDFEGRSIVIYVWHLEIQGAIKEYLEKIGRKVVVLNGGTKDDEKDDLRDAFNEGVYDVIVTNAKRSLNLHGGDVCIFYSVETNPATVEQIAARIDRNVNNNSKTFVLLAYEGEEANFFIDTVAQRSVDSADLTDVASETVLRFGELLLDALEAD